MVRGGKDGDVYLFQDLRMTRISTFGRATLEFRPAHEPDLRDGCLRLDLTELPNLLRGAIRLYGADAVRKAIQGPLS